jgi:anaerobic ribonucleoside-triphosphate reductase activating protein
MQDILRIAGIAKQSIVDGPGLRLTVFAQGCPHRCEGCHNPHTFDFEGGSARTLDSILQDFDANPLLKGITLSGGEPFAQPEQMATLAKAVKARGKDVVCYTGYTFEELMEMRQTAPAVRELLEQIDLLIDGRFVLEKRDLTLRFCGSANQRLLDLPASLAQGRAVDWIDAY